MTNPVFSDPTPYEDDDEDDLSYVEYDSDDDDDYPQEYSLTDPEGA